MMAWWRLVAVLVVVLVVAVLVAGGPPAQAVAPNEQAVEEDGPDVAPGERPSVGNPKLDHQLAVLAGAQGTRRARAAMAEAHGLDMVGGNVRVVVETGEADLRSARAAVVAAGGQVEAEYADLIQALVPVSRLEALAADPAVRYVRPPFSSTPEAITGEGVTTTHTSASVAPTAGPRGDCSPDRSP